MLYYLTEKYDAKDEWKVLPGYFGENWEILFVSTIVIYIIIVLRIFNENNNG